MFDIRKVNFYSRIEKSIGKSLYDETTAYHIVINIRLFIYTYDGMT